MTTADQELLDGHIKAKPGRPKKVGSHLDNDKVELPSDFKKVTRRADLGSQGVLDIPMWILDVLKASKVSVEWKAVSVRGDEQIVRTELMNYRQQGWRPVTAGMFMYRGKPIFEGRYYEPGYVGEILVGGQVLHYRPLELTEQALEEMAREARRPIEATMKTVMQQGIEPTSGLATTSTPKARAYRGLQATVEIPMPD